VGECYTACGIGEMLSMRLSCPIDRPGEDAGEEGCGAFGWTWSNANERELWEMTDHTSLIAGNIS